MSERPTNPAIATPPWEALRLRLLGQADRLEQGGQAQAARELRGLVEVWWEEQQAWAASLARVLGVHHDINNALVGVRGNAQLMLMGSAGQQPGIKERLEVVLRESGRIKEAASRLHELKAVIAGGARDGGPGPAARAA
ncbi:MAG: hypothetical protein HZC42_06675 [Candidatus Eisenbacteria bacterium]|nr:hypothetical protein [Candidatus Eisenbacteria bacterium]